MLNLLLLRGCAPSNVRESRSLSHTSAYVCKLQKSSCDVHHDDNEVPEPCFFHKVSVHFGSRSTAHLEERIQSPRVSAICNTHINKNSGREANHVVKEQQFVVSPLQFFDALSPV
jgi:hypothetical protein